MPSPSRRTSIEAVWRIRPEQPADEQAVDAVVQAAFGGQAVAALLRAMRRDHCWLGLSFVAEPADAPGEVVGHVSYTRAWVDAPERLVEVLVLSPLSVLPRAQRQGVGRGLVHRSIEALSARDEPAVFLEGDPAYYQRLGFARGRDLGFERPSTRIPDAAFQLWPLPRYDERVAGALVYPDVFWRHDAVGLRG